MIGLGTIINTLAVIIGGLLGFVFGGILKDRHKESLTLACGVSVLFISIAGAMEGMLSVNGENLNSKNAMLITICMLLGTIVGEIINIEGLLEKFGKWLKIKSGNSKDVKFVDGFLTTSFTICIGAMAVVGSIQDGMTGDYSILAIKSVLDLIIVMVLTGSMGKGCIFSAIPVFLFQGSITLLSKVIEPIMTSEALLNLSTIGSILIFCIGINLIWDRKIRVANMLPSIVFSVIAVYLPF